MPIDIGPIHLGDPEAPPAAAAPTLIVNDVLSELPDGVTVYSLTSHDSTGKAITDRAPSPTYVLQPGDSFELRGNGKTWVTQVNADASDINAPTQISTPPSRNASASNYPPATTMAPDAPKAMQSFYDSVMADPTATAADRADALTKLTAAENAAKSANLKSGTISTQQTALADSAREKIAAGQKPTQSELAALNASGATSTGSDAPASLSAAITSAASKYGVPASALYGIWKNEDGTYPNPYVNSSGYGGLFGTSQSDAQSKGFDLTDPGSVQQQADQAAQVLADGLKQANGDIKGALSYFNTGQVDSPDGLAYAAKALGAGGNVNLASAPNVKNFGTAEAPSWQQYNPATGKWMPAPGVPDQLTSGTPIPKTMQALQGFNETVQTIKSQLAAGTIDLATANQYQQTNWQNYQAALQGTTPYELQQAQAKMASDQAAQGEKIIQQQLTSQQDLTNSLLQAQTAGQAHSFAGATFDPMAYAKAVTDTGPGGGPLMSGLAQALIQAGARGVPTTGPLIPDMPASQAITPQPLGTVSEPAPPVVPPGPQPTINLGGGLPGAGNAGDPRLQVSQTNPQTGLTPEETQNAMQAAAVQAGIGVA